MAKALVTLGHSLGSRGSVYLSYTVVTDGGKSWSGGVQVDFTLLSKTNTNVKDAIISQAADRGVTLTSTDIIVSGFPE